MIKINANQLEQKLAQPNSFLYFVLVGNEPYLLFTAEKTVRAYCRQQDYIEQLSFTIDNQTDWDTILQMSQSMSLFAEKKMIILQFGEQNLNAALIKKLDQLTEHLSSDISLMVILPKMTKQQENGNWFKAIAGQLLVISCLSPTPQTLPQFITQLAKANELEIDSNGISLLSYYYEGNLLALSQLMEQLKLRYPTEPISYDLLEKNINNLAIFTPFHWVDAMLQKKIKRTAHILNQLKINEMEPVILIRVIQRELILLINLKKESSNTSLRAAFDLYKVWQNRRDLLGSYLSSTSLNDLYHSLDRLTQLEITLKTDYQAPIWDALSEFSFGFIGSK